MNRIDIIRVKKRGEGVTALMETFDSLDAISSHSLRIHQTPKRVGYKRLGIHCAEYFFKSFRRIGLRQGVDL